MFKFVFSKYSASGNDFILVDNRSLMWMPGTKQIQKLCARRTGIGADGLILLENSFKASIKLTIYNADGSLAEMCGNAARCITHYCHHEIKIQDEPKYTIETLNGVYEGEFFDDSIRIKMTELNRLGEIDLSDFAFKNSLFVDTGVPHSVFQVEKLDGLDVMGIGRRIRLDDRFIKGSNVDFIEVLDESEQKIKLRVYERGVEAETLCCGTGIMASAIACRKFFGWTGQIHVETLGGKLCATVNETLDELYFSGPVDLLFTGEASV